MDQHNPPKKWVRVQEIAAYFDVTRAAVYQWVNQGRIKALRLGDTVRITPEEFTYLKEHGLRDATSDDKPEDMQKPELVGVAA